MVDISAASVANVPLLVLELEELDDAELQDDQNFYHADRARLAHLGVTLKFMKQAYRKAAKAMRISCDWTGTRADLDAAIATLLEQFGETPQSVGACEARACALSSRDPQALSTARVLQTLLAAEKFGADVLKDKVHRSLSSFRALFTDTTILLVLSADVLLVGQTLPWVEEQARSQVEVFDPKAAWRKAASAFRFVARAKGVAHSADRRPDPAPASPQPEVLGRPSPDAEDPQSTASSARGRVERAESSELASSQPVLPASTESAPEDSVPLRTIELGLQALQGGASRDAELPDLPRALRAAGRQSLKPSRLTAHIEQVEDDEAQGLLERQALAPSQGYLRRLARGDVWPERRWRQLQALLKVSGDLKQDLVAVFAYCFDGGATPWFADAPLTHLERRVAVLRRHLEAAPRRHRTEREARAAEHEARAAEWAEDMDGDLFEV